MKALLYKDLIVMKKEIIMSAVILAVYIPLAVFVQNEYLAVALIGITSGLVVMFPNYSFVHGHQSNWEGYLSATPLKLRTLVLEKFMLLFLALPMLLLGLLTVIFFTKVSPSVPICLTLLFVTLIFGFIQIPLYFILGPNKARIIMMFMFFIVFYGIIMLMLDDQFGSFLPEESTLAVVSGSLAAAAFAATYFASLAVCRNKEF